MKRIHLFEIEDQGWCPRLIREAITDYLFGLYRLLRLYEPAYEKIEKLLKKTSLTHIIDCCSGSGGPLIQLRDYLDSRNMHDVVITLTDKYPNISQYAAFEAVYGERLKGMTESIDACQLPASMRGLRCFFSSFHHFKPEKARKILQNAVDNRMPIAIFESTQFHIIDIIRSFLSPLIMLLLAPFTKRLSWRKFIITYIIPIAPLVFMWDYFVSNLRTYSRSELIKLTQELNAPEYQWEVGKLWSSFAKSHVPYLIGYPDV